MAHGRRTSRLPAPQELQILRMGRAAGERGAIPRRLRLCAMLSLWFLAVGQQRPAEPQCYGPEANSGEPDPSELWDGEEELVGRQFFDPTHPEFDPGWEPHLPTVVDADEVTGLMYDDLEPQHPLKGLYLSLIHI